MCVGVAETGGINTYAEHVCWRRRDWGELSNARSALLGVAETGGINTHAKRVCWLYLDFIL